MRDLDLETLEYLYESVRNYSDKQWIGFLIAKKYSDPSKCSCGLRARDKCSRLNPHASKMCLANYPLDV